MRKQTITANKGRCSGLYKKFLIRMYESWEGVSGNSKKDYLEFKTFREKICRNFSITKLEAFEILRIFEELEYVSIVKFRGIKLNYKIIEDEK